MAHMHPEDQEDTAVEQCPPTHSCSILLYGWSMIMRLARAHEEPVEQLRDQLYTMQANLDPC